jgi:hypothetical protein
LRRKPGRTLAWEWLLTGALPVMRALPKEEDRARDIVARLTPIKTGVFVRMLTV